jgi:hypothetical protein
VSDAGSPEISWKNPAASTSDRKPTSLPHARTYICLRHSLHAGPMCIAYASNASERSAHGGRHLADEQHLCSSRRAAATEAGVPTSRCSTHSGSSDITLSTWRVHASGRSSDEYMSAGRLHQISYACCGPRVTHLVSCLLGDVVMIVCDASQQATGFGDRHAHLANTALRRGDTEVAYLRRTASSRFPLYCTNVQLMVCTNQAPRSLHMG